MQIKTILRFHLTSVRMAIIKNTTTTSKCWWKWREKGTLIHCWWECQLVQPLWKTIWRLLQKLNMDLPYDPGLLLLEIYPNECNLAYYKVTCIPMFIEALFIIVKLWKQPRCPIPRNGSRKCGIYTQWNFTQPQRRMKFCHSQVNGWN
jgi:hypothetical protein